MPYSPMRNRSTLDAYESPQATPAPKWERIKRDPKQEAQAREEAEQEARDKLAALLRSERALALTVGSRGPITADPELVFAQFACGASIETVAGELGVASDVLAAWALHPDRAEQFQRAMLFCGHYWGTKIVEVANDLRVLPADRRVQVEAMQWAAAKMGREFYADRLQAQPDEPQVSIPASDLLRAAVALAMQSGLGDELRRLMPVVTQNSRQAPVLADERPESGDKSAG